MGRVEEGGCLQRKTLKSSVKEQKATSEKPAIKTMTVSSN